MTVLSEFALFNFVNDLGIADIATYCGDDTVEKLNANYCPPPNDAVLEAAIPLGWEVRLVFNELLNSSVENLLPCEDADHDGLCTDADGDTGGVNNGSLIATQPVTLSCGGEDIPYDGYYQPSGNHLTVPPGPALIIEPIFPNGFAATGSTCQVSVNPEVEGKDKEGVSSDGRGPYSFNIAPMSIYATDPEEGAEIAVDAEVVVLFNAYVDEASMASTITVNDGTNDVPVIALAFDDVAVILPAAGVWEAGASYTMTVGSGVQDIKGGTFTDTFTLNFTTTP